MYRNDQYIKKINTAQNAANGSRKAPFERSLYEYTSALHLSWHSSFMIMHTFAEWDNTGQIMAESIGITTV